MLRKIEGGRRRGWQSMRWFEGITDSMDMSLSTPGVGDGQGGLACYSPGGHKESDTMTELSCIVLFSFAFRFSSFHSFYKAFSDNHFVFLHFSFFRMVLITASYTMS